RSLLVLMAVCVVPGNLATTLAQGFRGHDRMELEAITNIVNSACNLAFLLVAMKMHGGLQSVMLAAGGAATVSLVLALLLTRKVRMPPLHVNWQRLRDILAGGAPFVFFNLALSGHPYVDANLLAMLASPSVVGWYAAAQRFVGILIFPAGIAGVALYPTLARFAGDASALRSKARDALRLVLMLGALASAGTALYADVAVSLVFRRDGFEPAIDVLRALAPYLFLMFVNILLGSAILAIGRARAAFTVAKFVALTVGGLLDVILIPYFQTRYGNGAIGLAIALAVAELVMTVAALQLLHLALGLHLLVADHGADAILHGADDLIDLAFGAARGLGGFLLRLALQLFRAAFGFHLLVADDLARDLLDLAAQLLGGAFASFRLGGHALKLLTPSRRSSKTGRPPAEHELASPLNLATRGS